MVGPEPSGSPPPQTQAEGLGPWVGALGGEGGSLAQQGFEDLGGEIPAGGWGESVERGLFLFQPPRSTPGVRMTLPPSLAGTS